MGMLVGGMCVVLFPVIRTHTRLVACFQQGTAMADITKGLTCCAVLLVVTAAPTTGTTAVTSEAAQSSVFASVDGLPQTPFGASDLIIMAFQCNH
jgi:hypothetical protein